MRDSHYRIMNIINIINIIIIIIIIIIIALITTLYALSDCEVKVGGGRGFECQCRTRRATPPKFFRRRKTKK